MGALEVLRDKPEATKSGPILVTGAPRAGTTWVGRMLAMHPNVNYMHEPFSPRTREFSAKFNLKFTRYFTYLTRENGTSYLKPFRRLLESRFDWLHGLLGIRSPGDIRKFLNNRQICAAWHRQGGIPLLKDPIALMSTEWLAEEFGVRPVVLIRHPAARVASLKRLNWTPTPEAWALAQPLLMRDLLLPFRAELEKLRHGEHDIIERASIAWRLHHHVILHFMDRHKDWIFLRHEDISQDPLAAFETLYRQLGLNFTDGIKSQIDSYCNISNPARATGAEQTIKLNSVKNIIGWKQMLTSAEVDRIRQIVEDISCEFYSDDDWDMVSEATVAGIQL